MVSEALRQVMLAAAGTGRLTGADVVVTAAEHPVCGDMVEFDCRLHDGVVADSCPHFLVSGINRRRTADIDQIGRDSFCSAPSVRIAADMCCDDCAFG